MTFSYGISVKGHLLLAIEALKFARDQPAIGEGTRRKIATALASARRDLRRLGAKRKIMRTKLKRAVR